MARPNSSSFHMELTPVAEHMVSALQAQLQAIGQGSSNLSNSFDISYGQNSFLILMPDYGVYLDKGTKPHMPPVEPIDRWIQAKGLNLNAWAVAMNIKKFGTRAQPFLYAGEDALYDAETETLMLNSFDTVVDEYWSFVSAKFKQSSS